MGPPELLSQFPILEEAPEAMGVVVWPIVDYEADDALASAADKAAKGDREAGAHLYAGQGSRSVCCRHTSRATGSQARHLAR
jgi:5'-3' exonuclease